MQHLLAHLRLARVLVFQLLPVAREGERAIGFAGVGAGHRVARGGGQGAVAYFLPHQQLGGAVGAGDGGAGNRYGLGEAVRGVGQVGAVLRRVCRRGAGGREQPQGAGGKQRSKSVETRHGKPIWEDADYRTGH